MISGNEAGIDSVNVLPLLWIFQELALDRRGPSILLGKQPNIAGASVWF